MSSTAETTAIPEPLTLLLAHTAGRPLMTSARRWRLPSGSNAEI